MGIGMNLKARYIDMESAEYTCVLHDNDAIELGVREQDRIRIKHERNSIVALLQTTDTVVNQGEVGILGRAYGVLGPERDEIVDVVPTSKPESVKYIKKKTDKKSLKISVTFLFTHYQNHNNLIRDFYLKLFLY